MNRGIVTDATGLNPSSKRAAPVDLPLPSGDGTAATAESTPPVPVSVVTQAAAEEYLPKTANGALAVQVPDLLYAAQDSSLRPDFEGKTIELIGQWMPDTVNNAKGNRFKLVRMMMVCCAADARPVAVLVEDSNQSKIPEMSWVKVSGRAIFPTEGGRLVAVVKAKSVTVTDPPEETMLY